MNAADCAEVGFRNSSKATLIVLSLYQQCSAPSSMTIHFTSCCNIIMYVFTVKPVVKNTSIGGPPAYRDHYTLFY